MPSDLRTMFAKAVSAREFFDQDTVWNARSGPVAIADISPAYAANILLWLERYAHSYADLYTWGLCFIAGEGVDDGALNALSQHQEELLRTDPVEFVRSTPLYKAIAQRAHQSEPPQDQPRQPPKIRPFPTDGVCTECGGTRLRLAEGGYVRTWDLEVPEPEGDEPVVCIAHFHGLEDFSDDGDGNYWVECANCLATFDQPDGGWDYD